MKLWNRSTKFDSKQDCPERQALMKLTGEPPCSAVEEMVKKIARNRPELPLPWLEKQVCHALYAEELRRGGYVVDVGLVGPDLFSQDAARLLEEIRPEFGYVCQAGGATNGEEKRKAEFVPGAGAPGRPA
ncbi:MAG: hypothetical protein HY673_22065 [Chloroflexi bacterium]|nr:hypothetical protein [Chloroflexota bacterium]